MSLLRPTRYPKVWRIRASETVDSDGDTVRDWASPYWAELKRATVQPSSSEDEDASRPTAQKTSSECRLFLPYSYDLRASDRVLVDDEVWHVEGRPVVRRGLAGSVYTRARLVQLTDY